MKVFYIGRHHCYRMFLRYRPMLNPVEHIYVLDQFTMIGQPRDVRILLVGPQDTSHDVLFSRLRELGYRNWGYVDY